ncbi:MAG: NAD(P)/FAD-dependent oxidoreductase [Bacillota bacterium]
MTHHEYCVVGSSAAAAGAIEAIRAVDPMGQLTVISEERAAFYSRPLITRVITDGASADDIAYRPKGFLEENRVEARLGVRVDAVDPGDRRLLLSSGEEISYGRLFLATGSVAKMPPIPGRELLGVHTLANLADAQAVAAWLGRSGGSSGGSPVAPRAHSAVVIGAGLIGLQAAEALRKVGLEVAVVEGLDRPLATVLDRGTSALVQQALEANGVAVLTSRVVKALKAAPSDPTRVGSVVIEAGEPGGFRELLADVVIMATGVRPRTELLKGLNLPPGRGIAVDEHMATPYPDVFAAGDAVEVGDLLRGGARPFPIWPTAYAGGRVAGFNMAGHPAVLPGQVAMNTFHCFGLAVASAGLVEPPETGGDGYEVLSAGPPPGRPPGSPPGSYGRRLIVRNGRLVGLVCVGDAVDRSGLAVGLIRQQVAVEGFKESLLRNFGLAQWPEEIRSQYFSREGIAS